MLLGVLSCSVVGVGMFVLSVMRVVESVLL